MLEVIFFIAISVLFFFILNRSSDENKDERNLYVPERKAEQAQDQFSTYEGVSKEDLIEDLLEKAERLLRAEALRSAEKIYLDVIKEDPKNAEAYKGLGKAYGLLGENDEAALSLEKATVLNEADDKSWNNLGVIYFEMEQYKKAAYAYERAIEIDKKQAHRYSNLAVIYSKLEDFEKAIEALEKTVKLKPEKDSCKFLFSLYKKTGDIKKADKVKKILEDLEKKK